MDNFARAVRKVVGLSQAQMAQAIGRSHQMVQQYEKGAPLPDDVLAKLKTLAARAGRADLAVEGAPGHTYKPTRVIQPGETLIGAAASPAVVVQDPERARMHALLDDIINSGDPEAISAVNSNLIVFGKYVRREISPQKRRAK